MSRTYFTKKRKQDQVYFEINIQRQRPCTENISKMFTQDFNRVLFENLMFSLL